MWNTLKLPAVAVLCFVPWCNGIREAKRQENSSCSKYRTAAYYANWDIYQKRFFPKDLPVDQLTHVLYAFANINPITGQVFLSDPEADTSNACGGQTVVQTGTQLRGCLGQLYSIKKSGSLKVLLSIGGATYSQNFAGPASSEQGRSTFASSAVDLIKNLGLDGLDINWEYPVDEAEAANLVLLLKETRKQLDKYGNSLRTKYHFELTFAAPAGASKYRILDLAAMDKYLDFWNLMAYDYAGAWLVSKITGHQANLFSAGDASTPFDTRSSVDYYTSHGLASNKIVLGMPIYGRSFTKTTGLGQSFGAVGNGTWEKGVYDYKSLPMDGSSEIYDEKLGASYSWDPTKQELISYDTVEAGRQKARWIKSINLGGAMWWESSADKKGVNGLIENVVLELADCIRHATNNLDFPDSLYDNVRNPSVSQSPLVNASIWLEHPLSTKLQTPSDIVCTTQVPYDLGTGTALASLPLSWLPLLSTLPLTRSSSTPSTHSTSSGSSPSTSSTSSTSRSGIRESSSCSSEGSLPWKSLVTQTLGRSIIYTTITTDVPVATTTVVTVVLATRR
ncbi:related to endochitinase class V precursor [Rhynchosporium graminicola]|uniref:chitinase n=1 Tax=Rhynchosporium graminicola TaxID=2792576 RepID=A0A1E1LB08_9HELO|nr:related to endochitinase class V precursor [Rhynchosporium commune]